MSIFYDFIKDVGIQLTEEREKILTEVLEGFPKYRQNIPYFAKEIKFVYGPHGACDVLLSGKKILSFSPFELKETSSEGYKVTFIQKYKIHEIGEEMFEHDYLVVVRNGVNLYKYPYIDTKVEDIIPFETKLYHVKTEYDSHGVYSKFYKVRYANSSGEIVSGWLPKEHGGVLAVKKITEIPSERDKFNLNDYINYQLCRGIEKEHIIEELVTHYSKLLTNDLED